MPDVGSVERYAGWLRESSFNDDAMVYARTTGIIGALAEDECLGDAEKVRRIRNALAAGQLVRAELREAGR